MRRDQYFTLSNKNDKTLTWMKECKKIKSRRPFSLNLEKAALLVLDMQQVFLSEESHAFIPSSKPIVSIILSLADQMLKNDGLIIYTRHITSDNPFDNMKKWWKNLIPLHDQMSSISPLLDSNKGRVIVKSKYSAFYGTNLDASLRKHKIEQVIITGVMTHLCCESTARDAFMRDFEVFFVVDATATYTEELHLGTLRSISHGFGVCISSEEVLE